MINPPKNGRNNCKRDYLINAAKEMLSGSMQYHIINNPDNIIFRKISCARPNCPNLIDEKKSDIYCPSCREMYNVEYKKQKQSFYIYIFYNDKNKPLYVGSTKGIVNVRQSNWLTNHTNSRYTAEDLFDLYKLRKIEICNAERYVDNKSDLLYLESLLIKNMQPLLNCYKNCLQPVSNEKKKELEIIASEERLEFYEFDIKRYLIKKQELEQLENGLG